MSAFWVLIHPQLNLLYCFREPGISKDSCNQQLIQGGILVGKLPIPPEFYIEKPGLPKSMELFEVDCAPVR
jgi:hypothetical protein